MEKKERKKIDWTDFTLFIVYLLLIAFILSLMSSTLSSKPKAIEFNNITIRAEDYNAIKSKFGNYEGVKVCSLEQINGKYNCMMLWDIDNIKLVSKLNNNGG